MCQYTIQFNKYIDDNYDKLIEISHNITRKKRYRDTTLKYSLLSEVIINAIERLDKTNIYLKSNTDFMKYMTANLKNYYNWNYLNWTTHKKSGTLLNFDNELVNDSYITEQLDHYQIDEFYIDVENLTELEKEFIKEAQRDDISVDRKAKYYDIIQYVKTMEIDEQIIFKLHYIDRYTINKIYTTIKNKFPFNVPINTIRAILKKTSEKIHDKFDD